MAPPFLMFFFFNHPSPTKIYTLSLHDALPIYSTRRGYHYIPKYLFGRPSDRLGDKLHRLGLSLSRSDGRPKRSEEHTSELQSRFDLVCRLLLEKKKKSTIPQTRHSMSVGIQLP